MKFKFKERRYKGQRTLDVQPIVFMTLTPSVPFRGSNCYGAIKQRRPEPREGWQWVVFSPKRSLKVKNHSPDGFEWGYGGSGPSQLALALLLEHTDKETAIEYYEDFKWEFVSSWNDDWGIKGREIKEWLDGKTNLE